MAPGYIFQVFLRVTIENQVCIRQRIIFRGKQWIRSVFRRTQKIRTLPLSEKVRILLWCTSRTHIRTFLRFHGFPESDRFRTFLIIKGNENLIIVEIDGIDEGIHQCLPLLRLGHIQLAEAKQPKADELLFRLWLSQPFLCNAGLQFLPLFFQRFQPFLCRAGQNAHLDSVQHIGDADFRFLQLLFVNGQVRAFLIWQ